MPLKYQLLIAYLIAANLVGFGLMAADKQRAVHHRWRIPEKTLFAAALLGGSLGTWLGMWVMHHKTRHWYFVVGMPLILAAQLGVGLWLILHGWEAT